MAKSREWDAAAYQRISGPQFSWGQKVLARLSLRGDESVLDAGCGTGKLTGQLLERLPRGKVVALDLSSNMVQAARESLQSRFGSRVHFAVADLQQLPFHRSFDCVFSTASFHWVPDHDTLFRELHAALKPGSWLIAQCGGAGNLNRLRTRVAALSQAPDYKPYLGEYRDSWVFADAEITARRLSEAGFVEIKTWLEPAPTTFPDAAHYLEFLATAVLHRHLERLPDAKVREYFLSTLAVQAATDDPPFTLDYWRLNLDARAAD
jgi:trans-aconitate 2-methyltransferase